MTQRLTYAFACIVITSLFFQNCANRLSSEVTEPSVPLASSSSAAAIDTQKSRTLLSFGARGDGNTDDSAAIRAAFAAAKTECLDGENKTYVVRGTLRADHSLCLRNVNFDQRMDAFDTRSFIKSPTLYAAPNLLASDTLFYAEDPVFSDSEHKAIEETNNLRTILVTGDSKSVVRLENVRINKGHDETLGNGGNAAVIYIDSAASVLLNQVEIFGQGRGYGIYVGRSKNVRIQKLNLHDVTWAITRGDRQVKLAELAGKWAWNNLPMYFYDPSARKFSVVRSQEQTSGLVISFSEDIEVADSLISKILFRAEDKLIPWQADGITLAGCKDVRILRTKVEQTWEGIDISGGDSASLGVQNFLLSHFQAVNSFAYGIKIVHGAHNGFVEHSSSRFSGMHGVAVAAPASDITFDDLSVSETGILQLTSGEMLRPWTNVKAGLFISYDPPYNPRPAEHIRILNSTFTNFQYPMDMNYGIKVVAGTIHAVVENTDAAGFTTEGTQGEDKTMSYSFSQTKARYLSAMGCEAPTQILTQLWDQGHSSVRNPVWSLADLDKHLGELKNEGSIKCVLSN